MAKKVKTSIGDTEPLGIDDSLVFLDKGRPKELAGSGASKSSSPFRKEVDNTGPSSPE